jgi:hypothetical protein
VEGANHRPPPLGTNHTEERPVSDYGFREYQILHTRVTAATTHVEITSAAARVTKFQKGEHHNPVY